MRSSSRTDWTRSLHTHTAMLASVTQQSQCNIYLQCHVWEPRTYINLTTAMDSKSTVLNVWQMDARACRERWWGARWPSPAAGATWRWLSWRTSAAQVWPGGPTAVTCSPTKGTQHNEWQLWKAQSPLLATPRQKMRIPVCQWLC